MPTKALDPNNQESTRIGEATMLPSAVFTAARYSSSVAPGFTAASASVRTAANPLRVATSRDGNRAVPQALSGRSAVRQYGACPLTP
jgi:hypothetical protein